MTWESENIFVVRPVSAPLHKGCLEANLASSPLLSPCVEAFLEGGAIMSGCRHSSRDEALEGPLSDSEYVIIGNMLDDMFVVQSTDWEPEVCLISLESRA